MKQIPKTLEDGIKHTKKDTRDFCGIKRWKRFPLPENSKVRKYLHDNFVPRKIAFNDLACARLVVKKNYTHPTYPLDVVTSKVHADDFLIRVSDARNNSLTFIYIPKENIDDLDPICDVSRITNSESFYKLNKTFSVAIKELNL